MTRAGIESFRRVAQQSRESSTGTVVTLSYSSEADVLVLAAYAERAMEWDVDPQSGRRRRVQTATAAIRKSLLPAWATADRLPTQAKITVGTQTFKVMRATDLGAVIDLACIRWPDDPA